MAATMAAKVVFLKPCSVLHLMKFSSSKRFLCISHFPNTRQNQTLSRLFCTSHEKQDEDMDTNKPYKFSTSAAKTHTVAKTIGYIQVENSEKKYRRRRIIRWILTLVVIGVFCLSFMEEGPLALRIRNIIEGKEPIEDLLPEQTDTQSDIDKEASTSES